jgi:triacylglycerol lipase
MIKDMTFAEQSALFAKLSNQSYQSINVAHKLFEKLGFTDTVYHAHKGSNVYIVQNDTDVVVICRGTEVKEWGDIRADLSINLYPSRSGVGKVHRGFRTYTDYVWELIRGDLIKVRHKTLWLTGHSLGAAMATLMARRCVIQGDIPTPHALFTYGSPRVGNREYINEFNNKLVHHRWVNDGDIVTKVPFVPWYYHCGTMHHINKNGVVTINYDRKISWTRIASLLLPHGIFKLIMNDAKDHSSELYFKHLDYWAQNETTE